MMQKDGEHRFTFAEAKRMEQFYLHCASACREEAAAASTPEDRQEWLIRMSEWIYLAERMSDPTLHGVAQLSETEAQILR
jgi:hypothetical protein